MGHSPLIGDSHMRLSRLIDPKMVKELKSIPVYRPRVKDMAIESVEIRDRLIKSGRIRPA